MKIWLSEHLTFKRTSSFVVELIVGTIPILFALMLQTPPQFLEAVNIGILQITVVFIVLAYFIISIWLLSEAGASTYSPKLHRFPFIVKSSLTYLLVSTVLITSGYILLSGNSIAALLTLRNFLTGALVVLLYGMLAVAAHSSNIINRTKRSKKERLVEDFEGAVREIQLSNSVNENSEVLENVGEKLIDEFRDEPMTDERFIQRFESWITEYSNYRSRGKVKIVGGEGPSNELDEPWKELCSEYEYIRKELSGMGSQAFSR